MQERCSGENLKRNKLQIQTNAKQTISALGKKPEIVAWRAKYARRLKAKENYVANKKTVIDLDET